MTRLSPSGSAAAAALRARRSRPSRFGRSRKRARQRASGGCLRSRRQARRARPHRGRAPPGRPPHAARARSACSAGGTHRNAVGGGAKSVRRAQRRRGRRPCRRWRWRAASFAAAQGQRRDLRCRAILGSTMTVHFIGAGNPALRTSSLCAGAISSRARLSASTPARSCPLRCSIIALRARESRRYGAA